MVLTAFEVKDKQRRVMRLNASRIKDYFADWSKKTDEDNLQKCEGLLFEARKIKTDYEQLIYEMLAVMEFETPADEKKKEDELFKDLDEVSFGIISICGRINAYLKTAGARARESIASFDQSSTGRAPDIRLPKINIPKFDGDPRKFLKFKSLFSNLIHEDTTIPSVRKLYYLQEALEGAAEEFIRDVDMTETSYNSAWAELLNRYENKRVIIRAHLADLFGLKRIKDETGIRLLLDSVTASLRGLKGCGENPDQWSTPLSYLVSSKLDDTTKRDFENSFDDKKTYPSFKDLSKFLETRASAVEERKGLVTSSKPKPNTPVPAVNKTAISAEPSKSTKKSFSTGSSSSSSKCHACNDYHLLIECKVFLAKTPQERYEVIRSNHLCANCFSRGHKPSDCRRATCKLCHLKHNTLLHFDRPEKSQKDSKVNPSDKPKEQDSKTCSATNTTGAVLLPTAVVKFCCRSRAGFARILSDPASEVTMVTESFVRRHRLPTQFAATITTVEGVGDDPVKCSKICSILLWSRTRDFELSIECLVVPTSAIKYSICADSLEASKKGLPDFDLAEANLPYNSTDIIVGAEYVEDYMLNQTFTSERVTFRNSQFGWIAVGSLSRGNMPVKPRICHTMTIQAVENQLRHLYDQEAFDEEPSVSVTQKECVEHFEATYCRDENQRFVIRYPLCGSPTDLSNTKYAALKSVDRIFAKAPKVVDAYSKFINEYELLSHLTFYDLATVEAMEDYNPYFLPQLLVIRLDKSTTTHRVVFHASFKNRTGKSLNNILMVGPTIQLDLFDIIIRFRRHRIAFAADVEKMYRQILVDPKDRQLQKIMYRESPNSKPKVGMLNTLTYGTAPASFIATKCLHILADNITESSPQAAEIIRYDFYMDDLITGADTVDEAVQLNNTVQSTLQGAKFPLRKYISNSEDFLKTVDPTLIDGSITSKQFVAAVVKVLGLCWTPQSDTLSVSLKINELPEKITKRKLLSEIASIFDILGILAPLTIKFKLLMQQLWQENSAWDDVIPAPLEKKFRSYHADLTTLEDFAINRHYPSFLSSSKFDLVGFSDASNRAYCAVVYIRVPISEDDFDVAFVCAKTRVAPLTKPSKKPLSVPRCELQAAVLLVKLMLKVRNTLAGAYHTIPMYAFSDSTCVLSWISKPPETWKEYVANRVRSIQAIIPSERWSYIPSAKNPADAATRGLTVTQFRNECSIWITGPELLRTQLSNAKPMFDETALAEQRSAISVASSMIPVPELNFLNNISSFQKLIGAVAYIRRVIKNRRPAHLELTADERQSALLSIIATIQRHHYPKEVANLKEQTALPKRSSLAALFPFLYEDGVLRVGGRLRKATLPFNRRHPIILPANSRLIELYVRYLHEHYFHATKIFVANFVNTTYWIVGNLQRVVKKVIYQCTTCRRFRGETCDQVMGQLPKCRVTVSDAFSHVGVDFAGPFDCKCTNHRSMRHLKVYIAVFVCLTSRAVHIEVVSNLTTASFLDTLKRFSARRGLPRLVMSDNGRTFVGAKNYLDLTARQLSEWASTKGVTWQFIPPRAPHQGGIWEAAVKSAKFHLVRVLKGQVLSFEEYTTVFAQIEAILNSRPLCYRRNCDKSNVVITPAHLALGRPLLSIIEEPSNVANSLSARYNTIRQIINSFWSTWSREYLSQLQSTSKWKESSKAIAVGDVVLLKEDNLPPPCWPMAIVTEVYPDAQGVIRIVDVRTGSSSYRRAINKLVPLSQN